MVPRLYKYFKSRRRLKCQYLNVELSVWAIVMDNQNEDFKIALIPIFEKVLTSDALSDKVRELQMSALKRLHSRLLDYEKRVYMKRLLYRIAAKKGEMILEIKTKTEMEKRP